MYLFNHFQAVPLPWPMLLGSNSPIWRTGIWGQSLQLRTPAVPTQSKLYLAKKKNGFIRIPPEGRARRHVKTYRIWPKTYQNTSIFQRYSLGFRMGLRENLQDSPMIYGKTNPLTLRTGYNKIPHDVYSVSYLRIYLTICTLYTYTTLR